MSTYVLMKILESAPSRYDRGIRILTLGGVEKAYDRLARFVRTGDKVLDIGCGTGALALRAARRGATVKAIDVNAGMLEIAKERAAKAGLTEKLSFYEMGVAELGSEAAESYDAVMSGLCFSELTENELLYALKESKRILKPGGRLLVADEVTPDNIVWRILNGMVRIPLVVITYVLTQTTSRPVRKLRGRVEQAGFRTNSVRLHRTRSFLELIATKPEEGSK